MNPRRPSMKEENILEPSTYDYYDHDALDKIHENRCRKYIKLVNNWMNTKKTGNEEAMSKAIKAIRKHKIQDEKIKEKCNKSGYYWY